MRSSGDALYGASPAFGEEDFDALAAKLVRLVPEELRNLMIREHDRAGRINDYHRVRYGIQHGTYEVGGQHSIRAYGVTGNVPVC